VTVAPVRVAPGGVGSEGALNEYDPDLSKVDPK